MSQISTFGRYILVKLYLAVCVGYVKMRIRIYLQSIDTSFDTRHINLMYVSELNVPVFCLSVLSVGISSQHEFLGAV